MAERQSGLRFDIYERVHLADNTVGVKELDEVELVPHIQVYTEGEHALLKGNLYLTGSYVGETGEEERTLEHLIPVEITLPLNRIHDVSQVAVDIDNFDVDLLNSRSLNVTGVLTLHGIEMLSATEESWQEEEETVFVSRGSSFGDISNPTQAVENDAADAEWIASPDMQQESNFPIVTLKAMEPSPVAETEIEEDPVQLSSWARVEEQHEESEDVTEVYVQADEVNEVEDVQEEPVLNEEAPQTELQQEPVAVPEVEEKKELKIGIGSKPASDPSVHLKSLIHTSETRSAAAAAAAAQAEELAATPRTDALEWKRLFAGGDAQEQKFSRMRVCIVQKAETIESIAQRYSINPREILLYNRVVEQDLSEGKVLLIPRKP